MSIIQATIRNTETKGQLVSLRKKGEVPGIIYGGQNKNEKISLTVKEVKKLINKENFLSNVISINIDGINQEVLPREISFNTVSDEPIHIDFLRIVKGAKLILEIPVKFINDELSPGLKRGGVLNIVRRKVELKCPTEKIPTELVVDLNGLDIGSSIKISSIKLPENVIPTIQGRDFVIATVAAPTIVKEPEKPAEAEGEAEEGAETAGTEGDEKQAEGSEKTEGDKTADKSKTKEEDKSPADKK
tara:strand:+ start:609 stop:1343 length:735 start_codon:yes stop_codon:yes gene_type:complete